MITPKMLKGSDFHALLNALMSLQVMQVVVTNNGQKGPIPLPSEIWFSRDNAEAVVITGISNTEQPDYSVTFVAYSELNGIDSTFMRTATKADFIAQFRPTEFPSA